MTAQRDAIAKVLAEHKTKRGGISSDWFGPTLGWWNCSCGWRSKSWKGYYTDRLLDEPRRHVADALLASGVIPKAAETVEWGVQWTADSGRVRTVCVAREDNARRYVAAEPHKTLVRRRVGEWEEVPDA